MKTQTYRMSWFAVFTVALLLGLLPQTSSASNAEGTFMYNDITVQFTHAYATAEPSSFYEGQEDVIVIVTNFPLSDEAVEDQWERSSLAGEADGKYVEITIDPEQNPISLQLHLDDMSRSISGMGKLELTVFDENRLEGRFYSDGEQEFFDSTMNFDFTFAADIHRKVELPPPTEAEKEEAANSVQAAVYQQFVNALHAADLEGMKSVAPAHIVQSIEEQTDEANKDMIEFMQLMTPAEAEFQRLMVDGNTATLIVSAEEDGAVLTGTIGLVKEGDAWKVDDFEWEGDSSGSGDEEFVAETPEDKETVTVMDIIAIGFALDFYAFDNEQYPICPEEKDLSEIEELQPYYSDAEYSGNFQDIWGTPYKYVSTPDGMEFTLTSYGADGAKGDGTGEFDADYVFTGKVDAETGFTDTEWVAPERVVEEWGF